MYEDTPNKKHIDVFEEDIRNRYQFEKLKDWPIERLEGEQWLLENEFERFRVTFPPNDSLIQGEERAFILDNPNETKEALTDGELLRLNHIKKDLLGEIYRAIGHRKLKRREHRHELVNSATDLVEQISLMILSIRSTIQRLLPW